MNYVDVPLSKLLLDLANPRLHEPQNQRDAVLQIIASKGEKLKALAKDIAENGLNPSEMLIVSAEDENGKRTVYEGNRRLCAMKCIYNPDLLAGVDRRFEKWFSNVNKALIPKKIRCVEMSKEVAETWLYRKHLGENGGLGTVPWSALQKKRWDYYQTGKINPEIAVEKIISDDEENIQLLENCSITTVMRILQTSTVAEYLGFEWKNQDIVPRINVEELCERFVDIIKNVPEVKEVYTDVQALEWVKSRYPSRIPTTITLQVSEKVKAQQPSTSVATDKKNSQNPVIATAAANLRRPRVNPHGVDREYLIPRNCRLSVEAGSKASNIIHELSRKVSVNQAPNAVAVLFRCFIEVSVLNYMRKYRIKQTKEQIDKKTGEIKEKALELKEKMYAVIDHLANSHPDQKSVLAAVKQPLDKSSVYNLPDMNGFVHDPNFHPDPATLKTSWDNLQMVFELIYSN